MAFTGPSLDRGAALDGRDEQGRTPLVIAAMRGFPRIVDRLLRAGAYAPLTDRDGRTALAPRRRQTTGPGARPPLPPRGTRGAQEEVTRC
jgi:ankyrin repeat protein